MRSNDANRQMERDGARPVARVQRAVAGPARALLGLLAFGAAAVVLAAPAQAAAPPTVTTGGAQQVGFATATLTGVVNPNGNDASYYFQYGVTRAYGGQTAIADAGAGTKRVKVSLPVTGLQPLSVYHYRLVAVNGAGPTIGADETLLTTKVPLSLAILASPNPVPYGGPIVVQGTLSGTDNANREVVLQANPFPGTAGFLSVGNPEVTTATGGFSFPVLGLTQTTQFRVAALTSPAVTSAVTVENVAVLVASHIARTGRAHFVRVFGTVTPAEDGMQLAILRIVHGHGVLVGGAGLRHFNATSSSFSRVVRVHRGVYRVLVRVTTGAQVSAYGQPLVVH